MAGDTLGHVAMYAYQKRVSDEVPAWQAVADAVVAEYEARRWQPIKSAPELTAVLVGAWLTERDGSRSWFTPSGAYDKRTAIRHGYTHWTTLPAPPKGVE